MVNVIFYLNFVVKLLTLASISLCVDSDLCEGTQKKLAGCKILASIYQTPKVVCIGECGYDELLSIKC